MKVYIGGDSFCRFRKQQTDWPKIVYTHLTGDDRGEPLGYGFSGCSWWSARNDFLKYKDEVDVAIFCHTDYARLPSDDNIRINVQWATGSNAAAGYETDYPNLSEIHNAAQLYYSYLYSEEFHKWAQRNWYAELDELCAGIDKVVHLHCFPHNEKYEFKNGVQYLGNLFEQYGRLHLDHHARNHMSSDENKEFAEIVKKLVEIG